MNGSLLSHVRAAGFALELYGKRIVRWNGGFLGLDSYYHPMKDESYEFFLLRRLAGVRARRPSDRGR